jgi:hypothetical protein
MKIGTKSLLFGAHALWLHPFMVAWAWTKIYGFPFDPRLWFAFFLHDIGYWGKPDIDGPEGKTHPLAGAFFMHILFDRPSSVWKRFDDWAGRDWFNLCVGHSRWYAQTSGIPVSRLCAADKASFALTPCWLYLPMVCLSGEIDEFIAIYNSTHPHLRALDSRNSRDIHIWHSHVAKGMSAWLKPHLVNPAIL